MTILQGGLHDYWRELARGACGGRGVSTSHCRRLSLGLSGTPRYSTELPGSGSHNTLPHL